MSNFLEELKRRKVFRVSATYGVVAWIIMQIGEVTFPALHLPDWILTAVVVILLIGFPVVAIIAWIFDKTTEGIVRTQSLDSDQVAPTIKVGNMEVKIDTRPFYIQKKNIFLLLGVISGILIGQLNFFVTDEKLVNYTGDRIPVAIADFENNTEDQSLNGLSGLLITSLEQSNYLSVLTKSRMYDLLKQMGKPGIEIVDEKLGVEICRRADIGSLVLTSIRKFGDLYSIDLKILDVQSNKYLYSTNVQAKGKEQIPSLIDEISKQTRISLAEKAEEVEGSQTSIASMTTKNLEAYRYYDLGEKALNQLRWNEAEKNLIKSIELDSTFALAYYQLARKFSWNYNGDMSRKYIQKSMDYIDLVPNKERLYITARYVRGWDSKIPIYEEIIQKYPNEKLAYFEIGDRFFHNGEIDKSIDYFKKSYELDPSFGLAFAHLKDAYITVEDHNKNIEIAEKTLSLYPKNPIYKTHQLNSYLWAGKFREYFGLVREIEDAEVQLIDTDLAFGYGYYISGDYNRAKERYEKLENSDRVRNLQRLAIFRGDKDSFIKYSDEALRIYTRESNFRWYAITLITRARAMIDIFDEKEIGRKLLFETENIFNDGSNGVTFNDLGAFTKWNLIKAFESLSDIDKINEYTMIGFGNSEEMGKKIENAKNFMRKGEYRKAIENFESVIGGTTLGPRFLINYDLGLSYFKLNEFSSSIKYFDSLKNDYNSNGGQRVYYYPKIFLYSGLANLELKNYRLAKSNIETFLQIWEPAPKSLKEKKMALDALKKINKAVS